jgi:hypothetical protein
MGISLVILTTRCVNFPETPIPTVEWQIDGNSVKISAMPDSSIPFPGAHQITALLMRKEGAQTELKADVTVQNGDCVIIPQEIACGVKNGEGKNQRVTPIKWG